MTPLSDHTLTIMEKEDLARTDEMSVFDFSIGEGVLEGPSVNVHTMPLTLALPTEFTTMNFKEMNVEPQLIQI